MICMLMDIAGAQATQNNVPLQLATSTLCAMPNSVSQGFAVDDARQLLYAICTNNVQRIDMNTGETALIIDLNDCTMLSLSGDGNTLWAASNMLGLLRVDVSSRIAVSPAYHVLVNQSVCFGVGSIAFWDEYLYCS